MKHYTYIHLTADTGRIFYVGKGTRKDRATRKDSRCAHWHNIVNKHGFNAEVVAYWETEEEAHSHEKLLIASFKDMGYKLANKTDGGEGLCGHKRTAETIEKNRIAAKKRMESKELRAHLAKIQTGKKHSKETLEKMSANSGAKRQVKCIETGAIFDKIINAVAWVNKTQNKNYRAETITKNCRGAVPHAHGYHWEYV